MIWRMASAPGGGAPTSSSAAVKQRTILAMESMSVPSQSKIINSRGSFMREAFKQGRKFGGKRGFHIHFTTVHRMHESQPLGVQKHALQPKPLQAPVEFTIAVFVVPRNRMAQMGRVHPRLMGASGEQPDLHERGRSEALLWREMTRRLPAVFGNLHHALARPRTVFLQRRPDRARAAAPGSGDQGEIALLHLAVTQHPVQRDQCRPTLGQQQPGISFRGLRPPGLERRGRLSQGGYPHHVPLFQAVVRARPAFVNSHLTLAQDAVNMALGNTFEGGDQEIVEPLAGAGFIDFEVTDGGSGGVYGLFHAGAIITDCWGVHSFAIVRMCTFSEFFEFDTSARNATDFRAR